MSRHVGLGARRRFAREIDAPDAEARDADDLVALAVRLRRLGRQSGSLGDPTEQFRADTRRRLMAVAATGAAAHARNRFARLLPVRAASRRALLALAVVCAVLVSSGVLVVAARSALPGQALYTVKRGTEHAKLTLADAGQDRALMLLGFAETRLVEVRGLVGGPVALASAAGSRPLADGAGSSGGMVIDTLAEMDRQTTEGTAMLTAVAVDRSDAALLAQLPLWTVGQRRGLDALTGRLSPAEQARADQSRRLLRRIDERATALTAALACPCQAGGAADELGPLPCAPCAPAGRLPLIPTPTR